jgi:hypothetical protein
MPHIRKADEWDEVKEKALDYIFAGRYSTTKVAELVGVSSRSIERWLASPIFQQRLEAKRADLDAALASVTYADKVRRILALNEMAEMARCEYEVHPILLETRPMPKGGEPAVTERFNRDAFECFRGALDDIAKELGQRKVDPTTTINNIQQMEVVVYMPQIGQSEVTYDPVVIDSPQAD